MDGHSIEGAVADAAYSSRVNLPDGAAGAFEDVRFRSVDCWSGSERLEGAMMGRKRIGGVMAAAVISVLMVVPLAGVADAQAITPADQPTPSAYPWWGADHPGQDDPSDPAQNDWHCDRYGNWHNDENDSFGHPDSRCQTW